MTAILGYLLQKCCQAIYHRQRGTLPNDCIRELGFLESNFEDLHKDGLLMVMRVVFLESKVLVTKEAVSEVLMYLTNKHPMLRMKIVEKGGKRYWSEMGDFKPDVAMQGDGDWLRCFEQNSVMTYDTDRGPLWRVTVVSAVEGDMIDDKNFSYQYAFVFGFHHSICDGKASLMIINDLQVLLNEYFGADWDHTTQSYPVVSASQLAKSADFYFPLKFSFGQMLFAYMFKIPVVSWVIQKVCEVRLLKMFRQKHDFVEHVDIVDLEENKQTSVKQIPFTKEETSQLFAACKTHSVTVQCVVQAAFCLALYRSLRNPAISRDPDQLDPQQKILVNCSMSLKNVLTNIPQEAVGCYISSLCCNINVNAESEFWAMARECKNQLHQDRLTSAKRFLKVMYLSKPIMTKNVRAQLWSINRGRFPSLSVSFTNLGNGSFLNLDSSSKIRINGHVSGTSEHKMGPIFANSLITIQNRLFWNVLWFTNIQTKLVVDTFVSEIKGIIAEALRN